MKLFTFLLLFFLLVGCQSMGPLERQVLKEKRIRSCQNAGGVWYHYGQYGRCDWRI